MGRTPFFRKLSKMSALVLGLALAGFAGEAAKSTAEARTPAAESAIHAEGGHECSKHDCAKHDCSKHAGECPKDAKCKAANGGMCCKKGSPKKAKAEAKHDAPAPATAAATPEAKPAEAAKAPAKTP